MKRLIFIFTIALFFCSCTVTKISQIPAKQALLGFDFRPYTEKGFLITPYSYAGEYEAIGLMKFTMTPEANRVADDKPSNYTTYKWEIKELRQEDAIKGMYEECVKMGADALVDFKLNYITDNYNTDPYASVIGYEVTGFAIKRK
jgi:hypothetical protein